MVTVYQNVCTMASVPCWAQLHNQVSIPSFYAGANYEPTPSTTTENKHLNSLQQAKYLYWSYDFPVYTYTCMSISWPKVALPVTHEIIPAVPESYKVTYMLLLRLVCRLQQYAIAINKAVMMPSRYLFTS